MRARVHTNPAYSERADRTWIGTNDLGLSVVAPSREEAKQLLAEATLETMTSMTKEEIYERLGPPEIVDIDPETDCLTQRLLSPTAPPIRGATPELMERLRRMVLDVPPAPSAS